MWQSVEGKGTKLPFSPPHEQHERWYRVRLIICWGQQLFFFLSSSSPPSRLVLLSATEKNLNEKIKTRALRLCGCFEIEIPTEKCVFFSMSHHPFPALMPELNMFLMISDNFSPLLSSSKFSYFFSCLINNRVSFCLLDDWKWIFNGVTPRNLIAQSARADSAGNGKRKIRRWRNFLLEFWGECHDNVTSLVEVSLKPDWLTLRVSLSASIQVDWGIRGGIRRSIKPRDAIHAFSPRAHRLMKREIMGNYLKRILKFPN